MAGSKVTLGGRIWAHLDIHGHLLHPRLRRRDAMQLGRRAGRHRGSLPGLRPPRRPHHHPRHETRATEVARRPSRRQQEESLSPFGRARLINRFLQYIKENEDILQDGSDTVALGWIRELADANAVRGRLTREHMRDTDIVRSNRSGNESKRRTLDSAWVMALEYDDLEGGNSESAIEKLSICSQQWTS